MSDKVSVFRNLLQSLSRLPGLGFLYSVEGQINETVTSIEDYGDQVDDMKNAVRDVRSNAEDLATGDDE